jgi:hypothetical protein
MSEANLNEGLIWSIKNGDLEAVMKHVDRVSLFCHIVLDESHQIKKEEKYSNTKQSKINMCFKASKPFE